ncbi:unnamed protein product [Urochloa humidicola]
MYGALQPGMMYPQQMPGTQYGAMPQQQPIPMYGGRLMGYMQRIRRGWGDARNVWVRWREWPVPEEYCLSVHDNSYGPIDSIGFVH